MSEDTMGAVAVSDIVYIAHPRINAKRIAFTIIANILYGMLLCYIYVFMLSPRWNYVGFSYGGISVRKSLLAFILIIMLSFVQYCLAEIDSLSSIILQCIIIISIIPGIVAYTYMNQDILWLYIIYWTMFFAMYFIFRQRSDVAFKFGISESFLVLLSIVFFFICVFIWVRYSNFNILTSIINVYAQRELASNFNMPKTLSYIYGAVQVCIPFLAVWALNRKKKLVFVVLIIAQILAFFSQGSKSAFFALIVGVAVHFLLERIKNKSSELIIIFGGVTLSLLCVAEGVVIKTNFLLDYVFRRNMFLPNLLNVFYYDFFQTHEIDYFRSSILRLIGYKSPYAENPIPYRIGAEYFNAPEMYTNNGLFSDAYTNLGLVGLFVMPLLIVLLLRLFDKCIGQTSLDIKMGAAVYIVFCLIGSSFFTNLFSHGFVMLALIFCFIYKTNAKLIRLK